MTMLRLPARLIATLLVLSLGAATAVASSLRPQDEFFAVNARGSCCTTDPTQLEATLTVSQLLPYDEQGCERWMASHFDRLRESPGADTLTVIYVHGNQITHQDALQRSLRVYRALVCQADHDRPVRFILWSWPSSKVSGPINDFRVKALRTRPLGWQLAWGLDQMPTDSPISLIGYSYGARIIGGATHILAGGDLSGLSLPERVHPTRPAMRVAFLAPATHAQWFGQGQFHGLAMYQIDHLWMTVNPRDPAMRFYSWSSTTSDPDAMGFRGPICLDSERRSRVTCCNVENSVGRSHDLFDYVGSPRRMASMWHHLSHPVGSELPTSESVAAH